MNFEEVGPRDSKRSVKRLKRSPLGEKTDEDGIQEQILQFCKDTPSFGRPTEEEPRLSQVIEGQENSAGICSEKAEPINPECEQSPPQEAAAQPEQTPLTEEMPLETAMSRLEVGGEPALRITTEE